MFRALPVLDLRYEAVVFGREGSAAAEGGEDFGWEFVVACFEGGEAWAEEVEVVE